MARFDRPLHELKAIVAASDVPVQYIPQDVRGAKPPKAAKPLETKHVAKGKGGRPRKDGDRYPSGKLKPANEIAPALWQRIRSNAIKLGEDARLSSELARLSLFGELTAAQTAAGFRMAEIYGRYERAWGLRRSCKSAAYDIGHGDPDLDEQRMSDEALTRLVERQKQARSDFEDLQKELPPYPPRPRALLEALVIEDRPLEAGELEEAKDLLTRLVAFFGERWRRRKPGPAKPERKRKIAEEARPREQPAIEPPAKTAFRMMMTKLRPDLTEDDIDKAYKLHSELQLAIADRDRFRRDKMQ